MFRIGMGLAAMILFSAQTLAWQGGSERSAEAETLMRFQEIRQFDPDRVASDLMERARAPRMRESDTDRDPSKLTSLILDWYGVLPPEDNRNSLQRLYLISSPQLSVEWATEPLATESWRKGAQLFARRVSTYSEADVKSFERAVTSTESLFGGGEIRELPPEQARAEIERYAAMWSTIRAYAEFADDPRLAAASLDTDNYDFTVTTINEFGDEVNNYFVCFGNAWDEPGPGRQRFPDPTSTSTGPLAAGPWRMWCEDARGNIVSTVDLVWAGRRFQNRYTFVVYPASPDPTPPGPDPEDEP